MGRAVVSVVAALLMLSGLAVGTAAPVSAAPVYELEGEWEANTPGQPGVADPFAGKGDTVTALWRISVNSDLPAPTNEPVENVFVTTTLENGVFTQLPAVCMTGGAYSPQSSVSADGRTLTCNIGTVHEGTAAVLQTPVLVTGPTGSTLTASSTFNGQTSTLPPVPIRNTFGLDIEWGASSMQVPAGNNSHNFDFEWTLFLEDGSDNGPSTVDYQLDITASDGRELQLGQRGDNAPYSAPCTPFTAGTAQGHPYTAPGGAEDQQAPFADCTLTKTGRTTYVMTLSNIDYSLLQSPTRDSTGALLPTDRTAVATGSIWLNSGPTTQNISVTLQSNAPTYTATTGLVDQDDPANNSSTRTIVLPGLWSHSFGRPRGGSPWDASYTEPAGAAIVTSSHHTLGTQDPAPGRTMGVCTVLDTQFVDFNRPVVYGINALNQGEFLPDLGTIEYYVGADPTVTPGSGGYDPNAFRGCGTPAGWTTVEPADKSTIKAVRWSAEAIQAGGRHIYLQTYQDIDPAAPIGQDIWTFGAYMVDGTWGYDPLTTAPGGPANPFDITATPGDRYPYTTGGRDLVTVISAYPSVRKAVDRNVVRPGDAVNYALFYAANGSGAAPTVDDYTIVDHLPVGMTYVAGSASPAPAITTAPGDGHQILTWVVDDVATNVEHSLTYQAVAGRSVTPGQPLTNTVTTTLGSQTSVPASAQVTVSTAGYTQISKTTDTPLIPNVNGDGVGEGSWTVTLRSFDPLPNAFTDVIDVLPYRGDGRGTDYEGTYRLARPIVIPAGSSGEVYYTTAPAATLSDDPAAVVNGAPNAPSAIWSTTFTPDATAVRVISDEVFNPGDTRSFRLHIATDGAVGGDLFVNRAQARAQRTHLRMRTSEPMTVASYYSANLKKYVQDLDGNWHDAQDVADYPAFRYGDTVRYRIVATNTGQGTLTNFEVADDRQPQLGSFTIASLAPGESESHEYEFVLDEATSGTVVNTVCGSADTAPDSNNNPPVINCDPAGFEVANYKTVKSSDPAAGSGVKPGDKVTYTVKVSQEGTVPADASFTDDLSKVLDDASYNGDVTADIGDVEVVEGMLSWNGTVPVGGVATVTYSVTVKPVAQLGDFGLDNVVTSDGCAVVNGATVDCATSHDVGSFTYSKTSDPASMSAVEVGETITYSVLVKQRGQGAVAGASLVDDLSRVLDDATYNGDATASKGTVSFAGTALSWTGDLGVGEQVTITYSVEVIEEGDDLLVNKVTSPNANGVCVAAPDANRDCTTTHAKSQWDLKIAKKAVSGPRATVGDNVRYQLRVSNRGEGTAPAPIRVIDRLPKGLELVSAKGKGWKCVANKKTDNVSCKRTSDLKAGAKAPRIIVVATTTKAATGRLVNVASVSVLGDTVESNNKDKAAVKVKARPGLPSTGFRADAERTASERDSWRGGMTR